MYFPCFLFSVLPYALTSWGLANTGVTALPRVSQLLQIIKDLLKLFKLTKAKPAEPALLFLRKPQ